MKVNSRFLYGILSILPVSYTHLDVYKRQYLAYGQLSSAINSTSLPSTLYVYCFQPIPLSKPFMLL